MTDKALHKLDEILSLDLPKHILEDPAHNDFKGAIDLAKLQLGATERVLSTQMRVDESILRQQQFDILPSLLLTLAEERKALAKTIEGVSSKAHDQQ